MTVQRTTELLAASDAAGKRQQRDLLHVHGQLEDMQKQLALATSLPNRLKQQSISSGELPTAPPSEATAVAARAKPDAVCIARTVLHADQAEGTAPVPADAMQEEQTSPAAAAAPMHADSEAALGSSPRSLSKFAQQASQTPNARADAAAAAQRDGMHAECEPIAAARIELSGRGSQHSGAPHFLTAEALNQVTDARAQFGPKALHVGTAAMRAREANMDPEPSSVALPTEGLGLSSDPLPKLSGQLAEVPSVAQCTDGQQPAAALAEVAGAEPSHISTEDRIRGASSHELGEQLKRRLDAACDGGHDARSDHQEAVASCSVVDMFASLHFLQEVKNSDDPLHCSPYDGSMSTFAAANEPARKKQRADITASVGNV